MVRLKRFSVWLMLGSTWNLFISCPGMTGQAYAQTRVIAATQRTVAPIRPMDVSLDADNQLLGTIVSPPGVALAGTDIQIFQDSNLIATAKTDERGTFRMGPLSGGRYHLVTANQTMNLRVWTNSAAPPKARQQVLISEAEVIRGQCNYPSCEIENCDGACGGGAYSGGAFGMLFHPLVIGTAVAAAIAIPLALNDDDDDAS
jgi:hypothetical protein